MVYGQASHMYNTFITSHRVALPIRHKYSNVKPQIQVIPSIYNFRSGLYRLHFRCVWSLRQGGTSPALLKVCVWWGGGRAFLCMLVATFESLSIPTFPSETNTTGTVTSNDNMNMAMHFKSNTCFINNYI